MPELVNPVSFRVIGNDLTVTLAARNGHLQLSAYEPVVGYDRETELAKEAYSTNKGILEIVREKKTLSEEQIEDILSPGALTGLDKNSTNRRGSMTNGAAGTRRGAAPTSAKTRRKFPGCAWGRWSGLAPAAAAHEIYPD